MPPELQERLDEYLATLPTWRRWAVKAVLRLVGEPSAGGIGSCLILLIIIFGIAFAIAYIWAQLCSARKLPRWLCP